MAKTVFLSRLAFWAAMLALVVIALGAFTRLIDAGLGCPDWPGCYGHALAPLSQSAYKAWAEMIHRYFVGGLSCFIILILLTILMKSAVRTRGNFILGAVLLSLLMYQILLGAWTVTLKLLPIVVTQHLLGGFFILSTLWMLYWNNKEDVSGLLQVKTSAYGHCIPWVVLGIILVLGQIFLGAWTSTHYASLSCSHFPLCGQSGEFVWQWQQAFQLMTPIGVNYEGGVLDESVRQTIQMAHRLGALVVTSYLVISLLLMSKVLRSSFTLLKSAYAIFALIFLQICLGISNVIFKLPVFTAVAHTLVAALLVLALISLVFKLKILKSKVFA